MPNPLKSYLHSTITTLLSPQRPLTPNETDYEVSDTFDDSTHSISDRIILQRKRLNNSASPAFSTPIRSRGSPLTEASTIEVGRTPIDEKIERAKIREFVDVKNMLTSLRNLEKLITDPEVDYNKFKKVYLESSMGLIESIKETDIPGQLGVIDQKVELENKSDLIIKIGLVGVQILVVLMDLFKPVLVTLSIWWQQVMSNDLIQKVLTTVVELVFVALSLILDYLKKKQLKSQRKLRNGTLRKRTTRLDQRWG